jgi:F-type H+-transporting ATPase subunit gamma
MASIQHLKRRIGTAKNIRQITKAMEMVAASKMRRAQVQALSSRPYARTLQRTLLTITAIIDPTTHPLLQKHDTGSDAVVLVSTDKSLAGSLNTNLFRGLADYLQSHRELDDLSFIIVGQKARRFVVSYGYPLYAEYSNFPDPLTFADTQPISKTIIDGYLSGQFRSVSLAYMDFVSTLVQRLRVVPLLPFPKDWSSLFPNPEELVEVGQPQQKEYLFEPDARHILDWLLPYYLEQIVYQTLLEAKASEHSARMVAMKNASDNAGDIITDLTLQYNKQRQAKITSELIDNTTAALIVTQ